MRSEPIPVDVVLFEVKEIAHIHVKVFSYPAIPYVNTTCKADRFSNLEIKRRGEWDQKLGFFGVRTLKCSLMFNIQVQWHQFKFKRFN